MKNCSKLLNGDVRSNFAKFQHLSNGISWNIIPSITDEIKTEKEGKRQQNNEKGLTVHGWISLNYEPYERFFEAVDLPCFAPEIDPHRRETRQCSLIFHRGNRFYRGLPRLARPDSSVFHWNSYDTPKVDEENFCSKIDKNRHVFSMTNPIRLEFFVSDGGKDLFN